MVVLLVVGSRGCFDQFGGEFWVLEILGREDVYMGEAGYSQYVI